MLNKNTLQDTTNYILLNDKTEQFNNIEIILSDIKCSTLKNEIDDTYYYYFNGIKFPLIATLTLKNCSTLEIKKFTVKVKVCGDLEAYMYQYDNENGNYFSLKNDTTPITDEMYENRIELDYQTFQELKKTYPNHSLLELEQFIDIECNTWMEVWIFDENDNYFCHLENWYFCYLEEFLNFLYMFFLFFINTIKKNT